MALFLFSIDLTGFSNKMIIRLERQSKICKKQTSQVWNTGKSVNYFCGKMKNAGKRLGFLVNFNVPVFKDGFKRYVNNF